MPDSDPSLTPPGSESHADEASPHPSGIPASSSYMPDLPYAEELQAWLGGNYVVESFLGQGGMGAVYRGLQLPLRRPVAIKILRKQTGPDDFEFEERFKREAYAMAALTHPNIVQVYDCGDAGDHFLFISMELLEGGDLSEAMRSGKVTPEAALALIGPICDGLQAAHERGIVHRDIKPANIFLKSDGKPKVADFGLAKKFDVKGSLMTKTGLSMGTPDYAAPEQYEESADIDHRADIYSLGVMFYQMLTGSLPRGTHKPPSQRVAVDPRLDTIVAKAMEQDPNDRYQTVAELKSAIEHVIATWFAPPKKTAARSATAPAASRATSQARSGTQAPIRTGAVHTRPHAAGTYAPPKESSSLPLVVGVAAAVAIGAFFFLRQPNPASDALPSVATSAPSNGASQSDAGSSSGSAASGAKNGSYVNSLGMKFVPVPGTDVLFCIHETRKKDYAAYAGDPSLRTAVDSTWQRMEETMPGGQDDNHPVVGVSYDDALSFCQWLSKREGRIYRLPTDREWSMAVGIADQENWASDTTPEMLSGKVASAFPWGSEFPPKTTEQAGNYSDAAAKEKIPRAYPIRDYTDGFPATAPVMSFKPNILGIYDLGGNVWEWVDDWYNTAQTERALRGAAWPTFRLDNILSSYRSRRVPSDRGNNHGFRCVLATRESAPVAPVPKVATTPMPAKPARPTPAPVLPSGDPRLAQLASGFQARYESDAQKPYLAAVAALNQSYVSNGIARARATAQSAGNAADVNALDAEEAAMEKGAGVPAEDAADTPAAVKVLRATYRAARANLEETRTRNTAPLYDIYLSALDAYTIELTKASKLEDALKVRALREKIAAQKASGTPPLFIGTTAGFTNSLGMKFVPVPGTDILMCIHETRVKDYAAFATENPTRTGSTWQRPPQGGDSIEVVEKFAVVNVLWEEASAFCEWLSTKEGHTYRLPTDQEWSAAVGIADREDQNTPPMELSGLIKDEYPWGKTWPPPKSAGNFASKIYDDGYATIAPVMSFEPNALGIYDLAGNAWEWCQEWANQRNRQHVVRGGAWQTSAMDQLFSSIRGAASVRTPDRGFRVVVEAESLQEAADVKKQPDELGTPKAASKPLLGDLAIKVPASTLKTTPLIVGAVTAGQIVTITPNAVRWSGGGTKKGQFCDWRGHNPNAPMKNGIPWMALVAAVGKSEFWAKDYTLSFTVPADGPLALYANDTAGGNEGEADVVVTVSAK